MGVDNANAAILVNVVSAKKEIAHLEAELARRVAGRVPDLQGDVADLHHVALVEPDVHLAGRHRQVDVLGLDDGEGQHLVAGLNRLDAQRVGRRLGLEQFLVVAPEVVP